MAGDRCSHVLDPQVALQDAEDEIAQLTADADNQADQQAVPGIKIQQRKVQGPRQQQRHRQGSDRSFPGLPGADAACERVPAKQLAAGVSRHIIQFHGQHKVAQVGIGRGSIDQERQVAEHPAEIHEAQGGEREPLELAFGAVAKDGDDEDHGDDEHGHGHEQTIPSRLAVRRIRHPAGNAEGNDSQANDAGEDPILGQPGGASELPEAQDGHGGQEDDAGLTPQEEDE